MNVIKVLIVCIAVSMLSACGVGEFFIKWAVNGLERDVAKEFKSYADVDQNQEAQIDDIAQQVDNWVRTDRLVLLYSELTNIADDVATQSRVSEATWASTISLLERPMNLTKQQRAVEMIAKVAHAMTDEQAKQAINNLKKDYQKTLKEQQKESLERQNKKLAKGLKIVFAELGISRTKAQLAKAKEMLAQRKSHIDLEHQATEQSYNTFIELIGKRDTWQTDFVNAFSEAWETAERGAKPQAPQLWEHNAEVSFNVLNTLLSDLDNKQREKAANNTRKYAALFKALSLVKE